MNPNELGADYSTQVNVKMSAGLKASLGKIYLKHGTPTPELLRQLAVAAVDHFERTGSFTLPAQVLPIPQPLPSPNELLAGLLKLSAQHSAEHNTKAARAIALHGPSQSKSRGPLAHEPALSKALQRARK